MALRLRRALKISVLAVLAAGVLGLQLAFDIGRYLSPERIGEVLAGAGALAGAMISFAIARALGRELVERFLHGHIAFCVRCSNRLLARIVFLSRLVPAVSFDVVSYGAGLTRMSPGRFAVATYLGMLPLTLLYNAFGAFLTVGTWVTVTVGLAFIALFFVLPRLIEGHDFLHLRRYFDHREDTDG